MTEAQIKADFALCAAEGARLAVTIGEAASASIRDMPTIDMGMMAVVVALNTVVRDLFATAASTFAATGRDPAEAIEMVRVLMVDHANECAVKTSARASGGSRA